MLPHSADAHEPDRSDGDAAGRSPDLHELMEEIETLEEQVAVLEEGLPRAPGMQRAALAKEIATYREQLDARRRALRQHRGERG